MAVTNLTEQMLLLDRGGRQMPVFVAELDKQARRPGVIIIHEIFGLNEHIKDIARRFARQGMIAYAPDLFCDAAEDQRGDVDAMRAFWANVPDDQLIDDLKAVYQEATKHRDLMADKVGVIGFCMGGAIGMMFACSKPQIAWVADYYGRIFYPELTATKTQHPIDYISNLRCPMLGLFAGDDPLITAEHVAALKDKLSQSRQRFEVKVYDGVQHAFFNDTRDCYDAGVAKDAWQTTLDFISRAIRLPGAR